MKKINVPPALVPLFLILNILNKTYKNYYIYKYI